MQRRRTTTLAILVSLAVMLTSFGAIGFASEPGSPKYIIIMFADGAGPGTFELGRLYHKEVLRKGFITTDVIMANNLGLMIHTCAQALVCDSAAAATAMFTGYKTNIGMIGMTPNKQPVRNLAEAAKDRGYRIGLVSTDAVWDATPGAFAAHAESRRDAHLIAEQYVALEPTIVLGGGRGAFVPKAAGGERTDGRDLLAELRARGYSVVATGDELRKTTGGKVFGLFDMGALSFEIERDPDEPSYAEMVAAVLRVMKSSPGKFIAMLENENTDAATHDNDLPATLAALEEFERGVRLAYGFYLAHPKETLLIVTSDHDTAAPGLTYAQRSLSHAASADRVYPTAAHLAAARVARTSVNTASTRLGARPTAADLDRVISESYPGLVMHERYRQHILRNEMINAALARRIRQSAFGMMLAEHTLVYWGSTGHTHIPVPVAAIGVGAERFRGYMDNTKFAQILFDLMGGR